MKRIASLLLAAILPLALASCGGEDMGSSSVPAQTPVPASSAVSSDEQEATPEPVNSSEAEE